jgi:hypothetical protein
MDKTVTIATHVGPLITQIRETDTVISFMNELRDSIVRTTQGTVSPPWHLLLYKSRILPLQARLSEVVDNPDEGLVYVHPVDSAPPKPRTTYKPAATQFSPYQSPLSTNKSSTSTTSNRSNRRASVSIVPSSMPPASYFEAGSLQGLESMGFTELRAMQALLIFQNKFDPALDWLLAQQHLDDNSPLSPADQEALNEALARYRQNHLNSR